eukprot:gene6127-7389_t
MVERYLTDGRNHDSPFSSKISSRKKKEIHNISGVQTRRTQSNSSFEGLNSHTKNQFYSSSERIILSSDDDLNGHSTFISRRRKNPARSARKSIISSDSKDASFYSSDYSEGSSADYVEADDLTDDSLLYEIQSNSTSRRRSLRRHPSSVILHEGSPSSTSVAANNQQKKNSTDVSATRQEKNRFTLIVNNSVNSPQEKNRQVYSTEYITAMRLDDSVQLTEHKVITDRWKNRYNNPIQVPTGNKIGVANDPAKRIERPFSLPIFKRPLAYIRYIENQNQKGIYDLDLEDEIWRKLFNERVKLEGEQEVAHFHMERAIFEFEKAAFQSTTKAGGQISCQGLEYDENTVCDVCQLPDSEEGNEMVFCDGCNLCVHQVCYGIQIIPEGNWYCHACRQDMTEISCDLCTRKGGALKPCTNESKYAHLRCAMWLPECSILDMSKMEPIDIRRVPIDRFRLMCSICRRRQGACIQCCVSSCTTAFHVSCATEANLRMELEIKDEQVYRYAYCDRHRRASPRHSNAQIVSGSWRSETLDDEQQSAFSSSGSSRSLQDFCSGIKLSEVAEETGISDCVARAIFAYWVLKRRRQHGKPLMRQFLPAAKRKASSIYGDPNSVKRHIHAMRMSLERTRSLCEMVRRREIKKKELLEVFKRELLLKLARSCKPSHTMESVFGSSADWIVNELNFTETREQYSNMTVKEVPDTSAVIDETVKSKIIDIIEALQKHPSSGPFLFPVNLDMHPDYKDVIKTPMDLATLHSRASSQMYSSYEEFIRDCTLIFDNCATYNQPSSQIVHMSKTLRDVFHKKIRKINPDLLPHVASAYQKKGID